MAKTSLPTDQITIFSSKTGLHNLDTYIEALEKGSRTLPDLLDDLYDETGTLIADIEMRYNAGALEYRYGIFVDPEAGWVNIATFNKWQGDYTAGNDYNAGDVVKYNNGVIYFVDAYTNVPVTPDPSTDPKLIWLIDEAYIDGLFTDMETIKSDTQTIKDNAVTETQGIAAQAVIDTQALKDQAATSATNAATSETNAAASELVASTSASNAATSETNAATSEANAATSEANAASSAGSAATSESNSSTSESNTQAIKDDTQLLYDQITAPFTASNINPIVQGQYTETFAGYESRSGLIKDPETGLDIVYADGVVYLIEYQNYYLFFTSNGTDFNFYSLDADYSTLISVSMNISLDGSNLPSFSHYNSSPFSENYTYKISKFTITNTVSPNFLQLAIIFSHTRLLEVQDKFDKTGGAITGNVNISASSSDVSLTLEADDTHKAEISAYGSTQGTGVIYTGQSPSHGGGIFYNGDGTPSYATGEVADCVTLFRREESVNHTVAYWSQNSNDVDFTGSITAAGNVTAYSDARVKTNIKPINNAIEKVKQLRGVTYDRTDTRGPRETGLIAQDVLKVLPEAVHGGPTNSKPNAKYSLAYGNLVGLLVESIKELEKRIERLEGE